MGIGFCMVVPDETAEQAISIIQSHGKQAYRIGYTVQDQERRITIKPKGLIGKDKRFFKQS
jgi:phosphoribosylaminoimidazole (AIR) synthetase